jgi:hypothetical protein
MVYERRKEYLAGQWFAVDVKVKQAVSSWL